MLVGCVVGMLVGCIVGMLVGSLVGVCEGILVGVVEGTFEGILVGVVEGMSVGVTEGGSDNSFLLASNCKVSSLCSSNIFSDFCSKLPIDPVYVHSCFRGSVAAHRDGYGSVLRSPYLRK